MNKIRGLQGAIYHTQCEFGDIYSFISVIEPFFEGGEFKQEEVLARVNELINSLRNIGNKKIGQRKALSLLVLNDLEKVKNVLENTEIEDPLKNIYSVYDMYQKKLSELGIDLELAKLYVVDKFPKPFDRKEWVAFNADKADEELYGVPHGIYIRNNGVIPYYIFHLLPHELIHVAIGLKNPYLLASGLEEGICDIVGVLYLNMGVLNKEIYKNFIINHRFKYGDEWIDQRYLDTFRQGIYIYKHFGLKGMVELIKGGREKIKQVEKHCLKGEFKKINLSKGEWVEELTEIIDYFSVYPTGLLVSPLAKYIAERIEKGEKIKNIIRKLNLKQDEGEKAIKELQDRLSIILLDNEKIAYSNIPIFQRTHTLRYSIPSKIRLLVSDG